MLVTWQCIAVPIPSLSWFLGSLLYFNREPDAEVRYKSRLEPELMSETKTWIEVWSVSFTVIVNTIKPKTKHECSRTGVWKGCLFDGDTRKRECVLSLSDKDKEHQLAGFVWIHSYCLPISVDLLIQVVLFFFVQALKRACDRHSTPLYKQMSFLLVKSQYYFRWLWSSVSNTF